MQVAQATKTARKAKAKPIGQYTGEDVKKMRRALGLNQSQFWGPLGVTQSAGSRYESDRNISRPVRKLIWVMYESPLAMATKEDNILMRADVLMEKLGSI